MEIEFLTDFLEETDERLGRMSEILMDLERRDVMDIDPPEEFMRDVHTLKGEAQVIGLGRVSQTSHLLEALVKTYLVKDQPRNEMVFSIIFETIDELKAVVSKMKISGRLEEEDELDTLIDKLDILTTTEEEPTLEALAEQETKNDSPPETVDEGFYRDIDNEMLDGFVQEGEDLLEILDEQSLRMEGTAPPETLDIIFRAIHTIKGNAGMIGFTIMSTIAHKMEEIFDNLRSGKLDIGNLDMDVILKGVDALKYLLDQIKTRQSFQYDSSILINEFEKILADPSTASELPPPESEPPTGVSPLPRQGQKKEIPSVSHSLGKSLRVDIQKLDEVMNLAGELVINKIRFDQTTSSVERLIDELEKNRKYFMRLLKSQKNKDGLDEYGRITQVFRDLALEISYDSARLGKIMNNLQEAVMKTRMLPVAVVFNKFPRAVRDISKKMNKKVRLDMTGQDTEIDKTLLEKLGDPLLHMIRNALDHGIEDPEVRIESGKPEEGTLELRAYYEGDNVIIEIEDDGKGIDYEKIGRKAVEKNLVSGEELKKLSREDILSFIFHPGFSTAEEVTDISGRGVGMDVVKANISELKGTVLIDSEFGCGTLVRVKLPLTLAIIRVLLIRIASRIYAVPINAISEVMHINNDEIKELGSLETFNLRGEVVTLYRLRDVLRLQTQSEERNSYPVIITQTGSKHVGIVIDEIVGKQEIVIKSIGKILKHIPFIAGTTIMGDGSVVLILDIYAIAEEDPAKFRRTKLAVPPGEENKTETEVTEKPGKQKRVLLVEDSNTIRKIIKNMILKAGYDVVEAVDGVDGLEKARNERIDLVSTDVLMPRMDGYEMTKKIRNIENYREVPILMITAKTDKIDRVRGFDAGADGYISKPLDEKTYITALRKYL